VRDHDGGPAGSGLVHRTAPGVDADRE
jgi:hypothetical protein